jgi:hypothetical protein
MDDQPKTEAMTRLENRLSAGFYGRYPAKPTRPARPEIFDRAVGELTLDELWQVILLRTSYDRALSNFDADVKRHDQLKEGVFTSLRRDLEEAHGTAQVSARDMMFAMARHYSQDDPTQAAKFYSEIAYLTLLP